MPKKVKVKIKPFKFQKEIAKAIATLYKYDVPCGFTIPAGYGKQFILEEVYRLCKIQKNNKQSKL